MKNKDILNSSGYKTELKLFLSIFAVINLVFLYYQSTFFIGNHDWDWVKGTEQVLSLNTGLFEGRYAKFVLNVILFGGHIFPFMNNLIAFAGLALGMLLLTKYWQVERLSHRLLIAILGSLSPFILGWLYFPINIIGNFWAVLLVICGLIISEQKKWRYGSILCYLGALGVYPSVIEMMLICWGISVILQNGHITVEKKWSLGMIITSVLLFQVLLCLLSHKGIIYQEHYNLQLTTISGLFHRIPDIIHQFISQFYITLPFLTLSFKISGFILVILAMISSLSVLTMKKLVLWGIIFGATILSYILTALPEEVSHMPRINFYGLNFLYIGCLAIVLSQKKIYQNIGMIVGLSLILMSINQDITAQKVWQFGKKAEENLVMRISNRLEEQNVTGTIKNPVIAGEISLRSRYYHEPYTKGSPYVLDKSFVVRHIPGGMYNFYLPSPIFSKQTQISVLTPKMYDFIQNDTAIWPSDKAIYQDNEYIILMLTKQGRQQIQAQLKLQ